MTRGERSSGSHLASAEIRVVRLISEAMEKVETDGVITVEESKSLGTTLDVVEGYAVRQRMAANSEDGSSSR